MPADQSLPLNKTALLSCLSHIFSLWVKLSHSCIVLAQTHYDNLHSSSLHICWYLLSWQERYIWNYLPLNNKPQWWMHQYDCLKYSSTSIWKFNLSTKYWSFVIPLLPQEKLTCLAAHCLVSNLYIYIFFHFSLWNKSFSLVTLFLINSVVRVW